MSAVMLENELFQPFPLRTESFVEQNGNGAHFLLGLTKDLFVSLLLVEQILRKVQRGKNRQSYGRLIRELRMEFRHHPVDLLSRSECELLVVDFQRVLRSIYANSDTFLFHGAFGCPVCT
jgi:hypothetical protein